MDAAMELGQLAQRIGATVLAPGRPVRIDRDGVYAGDRVSDLLNAAAEHALLVSNLSGQQLIRVAELLDVPAICFVGGQSPDAAMGATAREHGTALLVSPVGLYETCGRIYAALSEAGP